MNQISAPKTQVEVERHIIHPILNNVIDACVPSPSLSHAELFRHFIPTKKKMKRRRKIQRQNRIKEDESDISSVSSCSFGSSVENGNSSSRSVKVVSLKLKRLCFTGPPRIEAFRKRIAQALQITRQLSVPISTTTTSSKAPFSQEITRSLVDSIVDAAFFRAKVNLSRKLARKDPKKNDATKEVNNNNNESHGTDSNDDNLQALIIVEPIVEKMFEHAYLRARYRRSRALIESGNLAPSLKAESLTSSSDFDSSESEMSLETEDSEDDEDVSSIAR